LPFWSVDKKGDSSLRSYTTMLPLEFLFP
jgi:hypothetical protein